MNETSAWKDPLESFHHAEPYNALESEMTCQFIHKDQIVPEVAKTEDELSPTLDSPVMDDVLQVGDHVYQWRRLLGIPCVFQHHGIVIDIIKDSEGKTIKLTIADFSNVETKRQKNKKKTSKPTETSSSANSSSSEINRITETSDSITPASNDAKNYSITTRMRRLSLTQEGVIRAYTDTDKWHRVHYEASWWKRQVYRSGTATKAKSDPVGMVLARVHFILQHPDLLPDYHVVNANCECVAFWCKTGSWSTLQASSFLELTAAGQVKSSATLAAAAAGATSTVTVPSAGLWGWLGYTSTAQVSWLSLHPMAIPGLACYAAVTIGVPAMVYVSAHKQWKENSKRLSDAFWEWANENPEVFAELITHWSDKVY
ncbi:lecithin retinol acyltransferase [Nitzschia inconspicua]|uniref:Lecithin retinol acyltransferase n=1 Tax=Nitzschia inconspicua TaxID=303405 RepID=A0A9K3LDJ7_9STRA|nr:lecithin retinol acyltransferase [Nitzschia inconspicua]